MEAPTTFVTATQKWVKNRIQEVHTYIDDVKSSLLEVISALDQREIRDIQTVNEKFAELADHIITGKIDVAGDAKVGGDLTVNAGLTAGAGVTTAGPISCNHSDGLQLFTPGQSVPTGLTPTTLSIVNERGKMTRFFMRGDKLVFNYEYDKIFVYYNKALGSNLRYLTRGATPLGAIVTEINQYQTHEGRLATIEQWFNKALPDGKHAPYRMFGTTVEELYPALGTPFMIPESMLFTCPPIYKIDSIKILNATGQAIKILKDFKSMDINQLLINFPYIHDVPDVVSSTDPEAGLGYIPPVPRDEAPDTIHDEVSSVMGCNLVNIQHVNDYEHGYYEFTDRDMFQRGLFHESPDSIIPNVIIRLSDFPKDLPCVLYFDVVAKSTY